MNYDDVVRIFESSDCLYTEQEVTRQLDNLANEITLEHSKSCPVILCVMTGGLIPLGHLLTRLQFPLELDYIHVTRYQGNIRGGELFWKVKPSVSLQDRHVIIVDDILDEGITLASIVDYCEQAGANSVSSAVLVEKMHNRKNGLKATYSALEIEDRYVFGFGMDYKGWLRNINGIYALKESSLNDI